MWPNQGRENQEGGVTIDFKSSAVTFQLKVKLFWTFMGVVYRYIYPNFLFIDVICNSMLLTFYSSIFTH